jgi:polyisoprenoid-binding protein YceI
MTIETPSAIIPAGKWTLVQEESRVGFSVKRAGVNKVTGEFKDYTATVHAGDAVADFAVEAVVQAASFDSGDADRDAKVTSKEFFNVANYPELKFSSTELKQDGDEFTLLGNMTIHGVTKPVEFDVEFKGLSRNEVGYPLAGFTAESVISRKDFGLKWDSPLDVGLVLSDKVTINLDLLFVDETQVL